MLQNVFQLKADLKKKSTFARTPEIVQNDNVRFEIEVTDNGKPLALDNVQTVSLAHSTKGETVVTSGEIEGNKVIFNLGTLETKYVGQVNATVQLYDAEGRISTIKFPYYVVADPTGKDYVPSEKEQTLIEVVMSEAQAKIDELSQVDVVDLKAKQDEFTVQLAQTSKLREIDSANLSLPTTKQQKAYVTFVDDDATKAVIDKLLPLFSEKGVPCTVAANIDNKNVTNVPFMTPENLRMLQNDYGWEIANHGYTHVRLDLVTGEELRHEIVDCFNTLRSWGLDVENIVYPFGNISTEGQVLASKYHKSGYVAGGGNARLPIKNSFGINRTALGSFYATNENTYEFYKSKVDQAITENGWCIFMTHCWNDLHDETQQQYLSDIIDYCLANNVEIVNLRDGYKNFGNQFEMTNRLILTNEGNIIDFDDNSFKTITDNTVNNNTPASYFQSNSQTITRIHGDLGNTDGFPQYRNIGTLITFNPMFAGYTSQTYYSATYNEIYGRTWDYTNKIWREWVLLTPASKQIEFSSTAQDATIISQPIGDYQRLKEYIFPVKNGAGSPNGVGGVYKVYRMHDDTYSYSEYKEYNTANRYSRNWSGGSWGEWTQLNT